MAIALDTPPAAARQRVLEHRVEAVTPRAYGCDRLRISAHVTAACMKICNAPIAARRVFSLIRGWSHMREAPSLAPTAIAHDVARRGDRQQGGSGSKVYLRAGDTDVSFNVTQLQAVSVEAWQGTIRSPA